MYDGSLGLLRLLGLLYIIARVFVGVISSHTPFITRTSDVFPWHSLVNITVIKLD
jgi:hypothetical protein